MHGAGGAPLCTCSSSVPTDSLATSSLVAYYVLARTLFFSFLFGRKMMYITWHLKIRELYKTKREREGNIPFGGFSCTKQKDKRELYQTKRFNGFSGKSEILIRSQIIVVIKFFIYI
jgi:hypothetical protein